MSKKINTKQYLRRAITILIFALLVVTFCPQNIYAEATGYKISGTRPTNGANNVPQNLQSNATGTLCSSSGASTICTVMVGISPTNPSNGIGYPIVDGNTFDPNAISVTSPNDPDLTVRFSGNSEGNAAGDMNFYHTFSFLISNSNFPNGVILMPNATYAITIKSGLKAYYESNYQHIDAYLGQDYSWSFTTGDGPIPPRQTTAGSPSPSPTSVPSSSTDTSSNNSFNNNQPNNQNTTQNNSSSKIVTSPSPQIKQQGAGSVIGVKTSASSDSLASATPSALPKEEKSPEDMVLNSNKRNLTLPVFIAMLSLALTGIAVFFFRNKLRHLLRPNRKIST